MRLAPLVAVGLVLFAVGSGVATGGAEACTVNVAGHCIGGSSCSDDMCYPCDPYPGHPLGGGC